MWLPPSRCLPLRKQSQDSANCAASRVTAEPDHDASLIGQEQETRSTLLSFRAIHFIFNSGSPGISELDGEAIFVELWRLGSDRAGKTLARRVDDIEIAVGTIVPSQTNICADSLCVGGVHLE